MAEIVKTKIVKRLAKRNYDCARTPLLALAVAKAISPHTPEKRSEELLREVLRYLAT